MSNRVLSILAGGSSRRFQSKKSQWSDKALMEYNDKPLLVHLIDECRGIYDEIGISLNSKARKKTYSKIIKSYVSSTSIEYIVDSTKVTFEGVLKGIQSTMNYFMNKEIQFVPSDRPHLLFKILDMVEVKPNGVSVFKYSDGMIEPLLALYGSNSRIPSQFLNLPLSRADVPIRLAQSIQTYNIDELIEKNALSHSIFANINVQVDVNEEIAKHDIPANLDMPSPDTIVRKVIPILDNQNISEDIFDSFSILMEKEHFYAAYLWVLSSLNNKQIDSKLFKELGKEALLKEKDYWKNNDISLLELHALQDLVFIFPEEQTKENMRSMIQLKEKMKIKPRRVN